MSDLAEMLEAERARLARKTKTDEQRHRERLGRHWARNLETVWGHAHLLTDEELRWLAEASRPIENQPARKSRWSRLRPAAVPPPGVDDAVRLEELQRELYQREHEDDRRRRQQQRHKVAERLTRLGFPTDRYAKLDFWAAVDSAWDDLDAEGRP